MKNKVIILIGIAGAGKSVQGKLLAKKLEATWMSIGELLRSQASEKLKKNLLKGNLLEDERIIKLVEDYLGSENSRLLILDGFPRTITQAQWLVDQCQTGKVQIEGVINVIVSEQVVKERLALRGRADDNEQVVAKRLKEYKEVTLPVVEYLSQSNIKVFDIDGEKTVEEVHAQISKLFEGQ